ncbi:hypothetical protein CDAR_87401 [Caerostris darwini]|uniref:Uncharacterized protein n=1 Tax=Caerostris darwini TaxID=1538125 RepID=A0AAV4V9T0_9ARAC|nr:hypothetical protein CDAR_87401 [Caerostris darwini]
MEELPLTEEAARLSQISIVEGVSALDLYWESHTPEFWDRFKPLSREEAWERCFHALMEHRCPERFLLRRRGRHSHPKLIRMSRWFGRPFLMRQAALCCRGRDAPDLEELSSSKIYHFIQENYERPSSSGPSTSTDDHPHVQMERPQNVSLPFQVPPPRPTTTPRFRMERSRA